MFAVIKTGGKQYTVRQNSIVKVEKIEADAGTTVKLDEVLMVNDGKTIHVGTPTLAKAVVEAEVLDQMRDRKIIVFKKKRRHNYRRKKGHRQHLTVLKIKKIAV